MVKNLYESSWWTWHLADSLWKFFMVLVTLVFGVAFVVLNFVLEMGAGLSVGQLISRTIVTIIAFLFTAGYLRLAIEYYRFSEEAKFVTEKALSLLALDKIDMEKAISLYTDYQSTRVTSPPILVLVWKLRNSHLNESWQQHHKNF